MQYAKCEIGLEKAIRLYNGYIRQTVLPTH